MKRRDLLGAAGTLALAVGARPFLRMGERVASAAQRPRPRFYLQIIPQGGMDAAYTTDPKTAKEVDGDIDVPYPANQIIEAGAVRLAPPFRALVPWTSRLAIVNAFRQNSANHVSGLVHTTRCQSSSTLSTPSLLEVLGSRRQDEAIGAVSMGACFESAYSPQFFGEPGLMLTGKEPGMLSHLDQAAPEDLLTAGRALRREAKSLGPSRGGMVQTTADNLLETATLFERVAAIAPFAPTEWKHELDEGYEGGRSLQRAMWMFENRLARCVTVIIGNRDFDTHFGNATIQPQLTSYLAFLLDRLFHELDARKVDGLALSEQTVVMIGSEIGRFPRLNAAGGKDHFPQAPFLFFGPWFQTGASYGGTGHDTASLPLSLATGRPETGGHLLRVDDIGTTLLHLDGANPEVYGYTGKHLSFLTG